MDRIMSGAMLVLIGLFLGIVTYRKPRFFWEFFNTRLLRKWLGDSITTLLLYIISIVFVITGLLLSLGLVK